MQQRFTLNILYPYIDEIHITKNKTLTGIYFKNEPLNIVNQNAIIDCLIRKDEKYE